ncbi:hypothetical protein HKX48_009586 [Thoreauomyces humboldtii]|nr:hypothetical protein HKX48_009586 [Thoreauomyces humboldtii]
MFAPVLAIALLASSVSSAVILGTRDDASSSTSSNATVATLPALPVLAAPAPTPLLTVSAVGTQNYVCNSVVPKWALHSANANLTDPTTGAFVGLHYFDPATAVPHWSYAADDSYVSVKTVFGIASPAGSIPWLMTKRGDDVSEEGFMSQVDFVARVNTQGGVAPASTSCTADVHAQEVRVPYTATYLFSV